MSRRGGGGGGAAQRYVVLFQSPPGLGLENDCGHSIHNLELNPRAPGQCNTSTVGVESIQTIPTTKMVQYLCAICPRYPLLAAGPANKCYKNSLQNSGPKISGDRHDTPLLGYSLVISTPALARLVCRAKKKRERKRKKKEKISKTKQKDRLDPEIDISGQLYQACRPILSVQGTRARQTPRSSSPFARRASMHHAHLVKHSSDSIILASFRNVQ